MLQALPCHGGLCTLSLKRQKRKLKTKAPTLASTAHGGTLAMAGVTAGFTLVQSCEQHQMEGPSVLPILERWAQGVSAPGLVLRTTFRL